MPVELRESEYKLKKIVKLIEVRITIFQSIFFIESQFQSQFKNKLELITIIIFLFLKKFKKLDKSNIYLTDYQKFKLVQYYFNKIIQHTYIYIIKLKQLEY